MKRVLLLLVGVLGLAFAAPALADTTYTNSPAWNGTSSGQTWSPAGTETYGETIPGNGQDLKSFTFYLDVSPQIVFHAAVGTWDGTKVGNILWQSGDMTTGGTNGSYTPVTITPPAGVTLSNGQQYVIFFTTVFSTQRAGGYGASDGKWGLTIGDTFAGGSAVYQNRNNPAALFTTPWDGNPGVFFGDDFAFSAVLGASAPPPPPVPDQCSNLPGTQAAVPDGWLRNADGSCFNPIWVMVCLQKPQLRADGTTGTFFQILDTQYADGKDDPSSPYYKATPAIFVKGYGTMCQISDVTTYGGDPNKFKDAGYAVNETGDATPAGVSASDWGAMYEYWVPAQ